MIRAATLVGVWRRRSVARCASAIHSLQLSSVAQCFTFTLALYKALRALCKRLVCWFLTLSLGQQASALENTDNGSFFFFVVRCLRHVTRSQAHACLCFASQFMAASPLLSTFYLCRLSCVPLVAARCPHRCWSRMPRLVSCCQPSWLFSCSSLPSASLCLCLYCRLASLLLLLCQHVLYGVGKGEGGSY